MSRRRRKRSEQRDGHNTTSQAVSRQAAAAPSKRSTRKVPLRVAAAIAAVLAVISIVVVMLRRTPESAERIAFPPSPALPEDSVTPEDFVGAAACASCHPTQFGAWRASTHGRAGGAPSRDLLLRAFDGQPIRFKDATVTPRNVDGAHAFVVEQNGREPITMRVAGVVGGGRMVGGGTQGFFTRWE